MGWLDRARVKKPSFEETHGLTPEEVRTLATYKSEKTRGIVHTPEWEQMMGEYQERYSATVRERSPGS